MKPLPPHELAQRIDYAVLRDPTPATLLRAVEEAEKLHLRGITTYHVALDILSTAARSVKKIIVVDFPAGASHIEAKVKAVEQAIAHGADEVEFVVNVWKWLHGDHEYLENEIRALSRIARATGVTCKALIETTPLTLNQLREILETIIKLSEEERPHYIKMNTGWMGRGVKPAEVALAARVVKPHGIGIKAAGGIRDAYTASMLVHLGADIIGTSSPGNLVRDAEELEKNLS